MTAKDIKLIQETIQKLIDLNDLDPNDSDYCDRLKKRKEVIESAYIVKDFVGKMK